MPVRRTVPLAALAFAAVALAAYPALRGYGVETGDAGAVLYARPAWLWAHVLGMLGFGLLAVGLAAVDRAAHRLALTALALVLPYYGAEAFGLHALGRYAVASGDVSAVAVADSFRYETVAVTTFALGLTALAAVGARLLVLGSRSAGWHRAALWAAGAGLATYLPQFFAPGEVRVAHGVLVAVGLLLVAVTAPREAATRWAAPPTGRDRLPA